MIYGILLNFRGIGFKGHSGVIDTEAQKFLLYLVQNRCLGQALGWEAD